MIVRRGMGDDGSDLVALQFPWYTGGDQALTVVHAADDPNFSATVTATAPPAPAKAGIDAKTLAYVIGAAFLVAVVLKK